MKSARNYFWVAAACTALYEILVSSPWWLAKRQDSYDMLINLTVPSIVLIIFAYYLLQKKQPTMVGLLALFIVILQISILLTIHGARLGFLS